MAFSDQLYESARPLWVAQLEHPFVRGIGDGTLEVDRFSRWVRQDYLYLIDFARLFAWAVAKADNLESMQWYAKVLDLTLNTEMALHRSYASQFGISEEALNQEVMWPTTRAYTDFLIRTAADGSMRDLVAALLPCAWGYAWLGRELASAPPQEPRYAEWVGQYASQEFQDAAAWLRGEMDRLAEGATDAERERMTELFLLSSRYEWLFWEMCWQGEHWRP